MGKVTSEIDSPNFLLNEKRRCEGIPLWGILLALLQIGFFLVLIPQFLKYFYKDLFSLGHPFYVTLITSLGFHVFTLIISNVPMYFIYTAKHPFFE